MATLTAERSVQTGVPSRHTLIALSPHSPQWSEAFDREAALLSIAMRGHAIRIEHVGSTAVPGLDAKPVIDIQISVHSLEGRAPLELALAGAGYHHFNLGDFDRVYPFFAKPRDWPATHHVHLCVIGSPEERRHIAFRDALRNDAALREQYSSLKHRLAAAHDGQTLASREAYSLAKSEFIESVLARCDLHDCA